MADKKLNTGGIEVKVELQKNRNDGTLKVPYICREIIANETPDGNLIIELPNEWGTSIKLTLSKGIHFGLSKD